MRRHDKWADLEQQFAKDEDEELENTLAIIGLWGVILLSVLVMVFWKELT